MRKHSRRLSLHKETLTDLQSVYAAVEVSLAPTLDLDCRQTFQNCVATRAVCQASIRFTECPAGCTEEVTNYCRF